MCAAFLPAQLGSVKKEILRVIAVAALVMMAAGGIFYWISNAYVLKNAEANIVNLLLSHKGIHHYVQNVMLPAYAKYQADGDLPAAFYAPELLSSSYIVRLQHTFYNQERKAAGLPELYYKLAAINPRNPVNRADPMEEKLIRMFNEHRDVKSYREIIDVDGMENIYVAIPFMENEQRCLRCHGKRGDAPIELQQRYPGQGGFNEKVGEIRAITSIRSPLDREHADVYVIVSSMFGGFIAVMVLFFFNRRLRTTVMNRTTLLGQEIEERKQAVVALKKNRATLKQILNATPQAIFWKDLDGVYLGCNQVFAQAAGLKDPAQITGKTDFDLPWPREEAEAYRAHDREVVRTKQAKRHIVEPLQQADGSRRWVDTTRVPLLDGEGKVYGVLGVNDDITERRLAEAEKREMEKRLRQAQKMESIGTMAGGIAHDFNNMLAVIFGYVELAIEDENSEDRRQDLEQVKAAAERARTLVKQILVFSRETEQEMHLLEVAGLLKEALKMLRSSIPVTIEIREEITSNGTVLADPTQIHQVIMNLCTNAYHAMRETGGILAVSLGEVEICREDEGYGTLVPGKYLKLEVSDTGKGIRSDIQEKIFEPYFTTKKTGEGTGLGLAVVHGIVKSHNGHITVYSEPGRGTTFHVYLPLVEEPAVEEPAHEGVADLTGKGERLLFVDDETQICHFVDRLCSKHGYQVTTFSNGVQALEEFRQHPDQFDLVITDMTMPYMTGAELAQSILGIRPAMPVILCTGRSELINREKALAMGISEYLNKPMIKNDFLAAIRRTLDRKQLSVAVVT